MNNYETVFILTPDLPEALAKETVQKFVELLQSLGAEIVNQENWGLKKLAYPIQKKSVGQYNFIEFKAPATAIATLETNYRRDESVLRFLTFRQDKHAAQYAEKRRARKSSTSENN